MKTKKREPVWTWTWTARGMEAVFDIHHKGLHVFELRGTGSDTYAVRHGIAARAACRALNAAEKKGKGKK